MQIKNSIALALNLLKGFFERSRISFCPSFRFTPNRGPHRKNEDGDKLFRTSARFYTFFLLIVGMTYALPMFVREKKQTQRIVVLDPAGDAKRTGRRIGDGFERGLTLQSVERIKEIIEERAPYIKVIITRMPGDSVYDLQNASLANRINADLFVNVNFYHTQETKPTIFLYQFSYGNDFACCQQGLHFSNYDQAYRVNQETTDAMCQLFKKELSQQKYHSLCFIAGPYALPLKPLIGIVSPSIAIELGLKGKDLWHHYSEPLANAIIAVIDGMGK